jgi:cytosine/adenosine deaminase-related metal-dependent hydrolase
VFETATLSPFVATVLRGGTVVDLEPAAVEVADLRIDGDRIVDRATALEPKPDDEVIDVRGKVLFPGLVSAHHHFYATLLRGAPRLGPGFGAELHALQLLEDVIDGDQLEAASTAGGLEGLLSGTTTVFDVSAAHSHITGSLSRVAHGLNGVGLRAVLAYEVTDRAGALVREEALEECISYASRARGRFRGAIALDGLASLSDDALAGIKEARQRTGAMLLANVAEDPREEARSRERFGLTASERLVKLELTGSRVVLAQNVHLTWPELSSLIAEGTWLSHSARSNMATQTGIATPSKFGVRGCLGTDVMALDCFAEAQAAALRTTDSGQPIDTLRFLANGHRLASEAFGTTIGPLQPGSLADLLVLDYHPPTPLDASTLAAHVLHGFSARWVESVMVDGLWRLWKRKALSLDVSEVARASSAAAQAAWKNMETKSAAR